MTSQRFLQIRQIVSESDGLAKGSLKSFAEELIDALLDYKK